MICKWCGKECSDMAAHRERIETTEDLLPKPGSKEFERARRAVARELKWDVENVMNWEVRSYLMRKIENDARTE